MAGRRGHGEGSIYKDQDGRWRAVLDLGWLNGKRHRRYFSGATRREVQAQLDQARRLHDQGTLATGPRQTVEQFLQHWFTEVKRPKVEPGTYERQETILRLHLLPALGKRPLAKLTPQEIQGFYSQKLAAGYAPGSVRQMHAVLSNALNTAVRWDLIPRNPASLVDLPKLTKPEAEVLDAEPARRLLRIAVDDRLEALFVLALTTGMRQGELLGLRWQDVDFEAGLLHVRQKLQRVRRQVLEGPPKTAAGRRTIELSRLGADALRRHRVRQAEERLQCGPAWGRPDLVFTTTSGQPINACTVRNWHFPRLLRRAELPKLTFHRLRHSFATLMLSRGESISVVQQLLGHSSPSITLGVYRHILPGEQRGAIDRLAALLEGEG
jgi:integrase